MADKTDSQIRDIPLVGDSLGDIRQMLHGNPEAIKSAYDEQIKASKEAQERMMQFLMQQKKGAQAFYGPIQHMFQSAYGTEGIQAPQNPGTSGVGPIQRMYGGSR